MNTFPIDFLNEMKIILKDDCNNFLNLLSAPAFRGLRINTLKCEKNKLLSFFNNELKQTPFSKDGYYITENYKNLGKNPLHHSGAFYIQEPSAMSAVTLLDPKPYDKVLDLCAAPGGKSTQISTYLNENGLLWSNEIIKSRANILLSNIERMGIKNSVVSNCHPKILCEKLNNFFDKILVDAPCSGEGMFRKDPDAVNQWSLQHSKACAERQLSLLETAKTALKPGGEIVYSTCTFSREENENVIMRFLKNNPDFILCEDEVNFGRCFQKGMHRIFPMDGGEGHFCAKLKHKGNAYDEIHSFSPPKLTDKNLKLAFDFYKNLFPSLPFGENLKIIGNKIYCMPDIDFDFSNLNILRAGILLGEIKKDRIEPAHCAFMAIKPEECAQNIDFPLNSKEINSFLSGEEINISDSLKGYICVSVENISVGFGKCSNGKLKNKYPKGLRNL